MRYFLRFLEQFKWYYHFKYFRPIYAILKFVRPELSRSIRSEKLLYSEVLKDMPVGSLVFDVGASVGTTTEILLNLGAEVIAIEPEPKNIKCLKARFSPHPKVEIVPKAVSNKTGKAKLHVQFDGNTLHTLSTKWQKKLSTPTNPQKQPSIEFLSCTSVHTTTMDQLIQSFNLPYYVKIDVEGYELQVLNGLTKAVPYISFEANLPDFELEAIACIQHMKSINSKYYFNYTVNYKLHLLKFITGYEMIEIIKNTTLKSTDIFCYLQNSKTG